MVMVDDPNTANRTGNETAGQPAPPITDVRGDASRASDVTGSIEGAAADAAGQAKDQASSLLGQAKNKVLGIASDQKDGLADTLDGLAQSVHKSGEQFAGQQDWIAGAIDRGATELSSLATSLRNNDLTGLVDQVKSLARRQPAVFIGACLAGGFALARLGKIVAADVSRDDLPTMPEVGHGGI
jgi:hypothetical protein